MTDEFRSFLYNIGSDLTQNDIKGLKFLSKPDLGDAASENIKDGLDFLEWLENQGKLSKGNLDKLIRLLDCAKRADLAQKVREYDATKRGLSPPNSSETTPPRVGGSLLNPCPVHMQESGEDENAWQLPLSIAGATNTENAAGSPVKSALSQRCPLAAVATTTVGSTSQDRMSGQTNPLNSPGGELLDSPGVDNQGASLKSLHLPMDATADTSGELDDLTPVTCAYQTELIEQAIEVGNCIVYAPSGCGKALVAALVAEHHLKRSSSPEKFRIVFVVDRVSLIDQKKTRMQQILKPRFPFLMTGGLSGQQSTANRLDDLITECHLIVLTADVLLNHLTGKGDFAAVAMSSVDLLIMNECHHTRDRHPYNKVMQHYVAAKENGDKVPIVLGLTSVIPVKSKMDLDQAVEHIAHLCANLDAPKILQVTENVTEMMAYVAAPEEQVYKTPSRLTDPFKDKLSKMMTTLEGNLLEESLPASSAMHGTAEYDGWVCRQGEGDETKRFCARCLVQLNHALIINEDVTTKDAIQFLHLYLTETQQFTFDPQRQTLLSKLQSVIDSVEETCQSPKLDRLRKTLIQTYREMPETQFILFIKTPFSADTLVHWISQDADLQFMKPMGLPGMGSHKEQVKALTTGESKLLVCSPDAVRGIDIEYCHTYIRYGVIDNEISVVRMQEDTHHLASCGSRDDSKAMQEESIGPHRKEPVWKAALAQFCGLPERKRRRHVESIQKREYEKQQKKHVSSTPLNLSTLLLSCKKCNKYLCRGDAVKKLKGVHNVVHSREFEDNAHWPKRESPGKKHTRRATFAVDDVEFVGKVSCRDCRTQLGTVVLADDERYPCIKLDWLVYSRCQGEDAGDDVKFEFNKHMKRSLSETIPDL